MSKGREYHDQPLRYVDGVSGREVTQITGYLGHSNHLYFTDPCWVDGGRAMVFTSDRENQSNLFRYDFASGAITQLTDLRGPGRPAGCYSEASGRHYYWWGQTLYELDVHTFEERAVTEVEPPFTPRGQGNALPTADGRFICSLAMEFPPLEQPSIAFAYSRFREFFEKRPLTRILRVEVATGAQEVIHEDRRYMGHVNTSPTRPELLTFCHEGPWAEIEQRIWGLNVHTGARWAIRPQDETVAIGHEYWLADGERIGYHGRPRRGAGEHVFGTIRWDNTNQIEVTFPYHSTHFHSLDETLIVGDGTPAFRDHAQPYIQLFRWDGERYVGPKVLAYHRSTFNDQHAHCHPRFTPDGARVMYASDLTAYANIYLVEVGDFESLPDMPAS